MKLRSFLILFLVIFMAMSVQAADLVSTDGAPNSSGVYPVQIDSDGVITFRSDAGINYPYEAATTSDTLTASESGKTISVACQTPCEFELPAAEAGMNFTFVSTDNAAVFSVDPNGTDTLYLGVGAVPLDAGDKATSPGATGDTLKVFSTADGYWSVPIELGTFTDGS